LTLHRAANQRTDGGKGLVPLSFNEGTETNSDF
jgi:hypothetical protein